MKRSYNKPYPAGWLAIALLFFCHHTILAQFTNGNFNIGTNGCLPNTTGWQTATGSMAAEYQSVLQPQRPGDFWIDLTPCGRSGNGTWIEQSVPMVVGNCYRIDFEIASHCGWDGSDGGVYITLDGQPLGGRIYNDTMLCTSPAQLGWKRRSSIVFVAQNNPTVVRFTGEGRCTNTRTGGYPCAGKGALANPGVIALDNIELVQVAGQALQVALGNDTVYCDTFTRVLDAGNAGPSTTYQWNTGDVSQTLTVSNPGMYAVTVTTMCGTASDTIHIAQGVMPDAGLGADTTGCAGTPMTLQPKAAPPSGVVYNWSTSQTGSSIEVTQPGDYWLEMDVNGCINRDTISVSFIDIDVDLGDDISICDSDTPLVLSSPYGSSFHHLWSNGLSDTQLRVMRTGNHWLEVSLGECKDSDTVYVDLVATPDVYIGADTTICEQFPHRIGAEIAGAAYLWNTGETTPYITVNSTNTYVAEVTLRGCVVYDTVQITAMPVPDINLGGDRDICPEQTIVLDGTYGAGSSYQWNTGEQTASIAVTTPGTYGVAVVSEHRCIGGDTVTLSHYPLPIVSLGPDTTVCEETPLLLRAWTINTDSVRWSDGYVGNMLEVRYGGTYTATAINKCGTGLDTIEVSQIFCNIWVPNVFTPNSDGMNDVFRALGNLGRVENFGLSIYNRWGERIFHTRDKYKGWDGWHSGAAAPLGTYLYLVEYSFEGTPQQLKGSFHLIR